MTTWNGTRLLGQSGVNIHQMNGKLLLLCNCALQKNVNRGKYGGQNTGRPLHFKK